MSIFSERLKQLRKEKNISQEELAKATKISRSAISNYEAGTREPNHETLEILADFYNVDIDFLLGRKDWITNIKDWNPKEQEITIEIKLSEEDSIILEAFHNADDVDRTTVLRILNIYKKLNDGDNK